MRSRVISILFLIKSPPPSKVPDTEQTLKMFVKSATVFKSSFFWKRNRGGGAGTDLQVHIWNLHIWKHDTHLSVILPQSTFQWWCLSLHSHKQMRGVPNLTFIPFFLCSLQCHAPHLWLYVALSLSFSMKAFPKHFTHSSLGINACKKWFLIFLLQATGAGGMWCPQQMFNV